MTAPPAVFFGGSSWGCIYHMGAYEGLLARFGAESTWSEIKWGGCSSGALVALAAALNWTPPMMRDLYSELAGMARTYGVFGKVHALFTTRCKMAAERPKSEPRWRALLQMSIYHAIVLQRLLPDGGSEHAALSGRLHIGVTRGMAR
jgi:predicted acylesterase/phospholipase RssA